MNLEFRKISGFNRGILHQLLVDSYSFDSRWQKYFEPDWIDFDNFFFDNLDIADSCGFITVWNDTPIGHVSWDPRNRPEYVQIGHNCIATAYKGNGYGKRQLQEALKRIRRYDGLKKIIVNTSQNLVAPYNYESIGFQLCQRRKDEGVTAFAGDLLDYEIYV